MEARGDSPFVWLGGLPRTRNMVPCMNGYLILSCYNINYTCKLLMTFTNEYFNSSNWHPIL